MRRDDKHRPVSVKALALSLPKRAWRTIEWREGAVEPLRSRFARLRIRAAHRDYWLAEPRPEEWLLIEWPKDESEPTKYWLSTLPQNIAFPDLVDAAKLRWRIERDYQELSRRSGLDTSKVAVGGASTTTLPCASQPTDPDLRAGEDSPSASRSSRTFPKSAIPSVYRPRGSAAPARTSYPKLDRQMRRASSPLVKTLQRCLLSRENERNIEK